jgi:protein-S-isoprenylcysteine O-methyltransferase Ste14
MASSFAQRGGWWVIGQGILMLAVLLTGPLFKDNWQRFPSKWAGGFILASGSYFGIVGAWTLGRNRTAYPRPLAECRLVTSGIYGLVRHPLYTSLIQLGLGWATIWQSGAAVLASVAMSAFLTLKSIREKRWLREQFAEYAEYEKRVKKFIPGIF